MGGATGPSGCSFLSPGATATNEKEVTGVPRQIVFEELVEPSRLVVTDPHGLSLPNTLPQRRAILRTRNSGVDRPLSEEFDRDLYVRCNAGNLSARRDFKGIVAVASRARVTDHRRPDSKRCDAVDQASFDE
jgi:hypothetical protein